jgi:hypothetical protein
VHTLNETILKALVVLKQVVDACIFVEAACMQQQRTNVSLDVHKATLMKGPYIFLDLLRIIDLE